MEKQVNAQTKNEQGTGVISGADRKTLGTSASKFGAYDNHMTTPGPHFGSWNDNKSLLSSSYRTSGAVPCIIWFAVTLGVAVPYIRLSWDNMITTLIVGQPLNGRGHMITTTPDFTPHGRKEVPRQINFWLRNYSTMATYFISGLSWGTHMREPITKDPFRSLRAC